MAATIEELEVRVNDLQNELRELREQIANRPGHPGREDRGGEMIRRARESQAAISAAWNRFLEQQGITGEPVGAERVQEMMRECGINPEDNEFSREIIRMREERG